MNDFNCVLFDLDGTLIDSTPLILESFRHTLLYHFNIKARDEDILKFIGIPLKDSFTQLYPDMVETLAKTYREFNEFRHDNYVGVFIGIVEMLEGCREKGVTLGVVTSKGRKTAMRGLKLFGLDKYMDVFIGQEDTITHKPEGEPVMKALEVAGIVDKQRVLYVGDSSHDILCAKNAGVKSAAIRWSYLPHDELLALEPDIYLQHPKDLLLYI